VRKIVPKSTPAVRSRYPIVTTTFSATPAMVRGVVSPPTGPSQPAVPGVMQTNSETHADIVWSWNDESGRTRVVGFSCLRTLRTVGHGYMQEGNS
jgi:hypothetical protein